MKSQVSKNSKRRIGTYHTIDNLSASHRVDVNSFDGVEDRVSSSHCCGRPFANQTVVSGVKVLPAPRLELEGGGSLSRGDAGQSDSVSYDGVRVGGGEGGNGGNLQG